MDNLNILGLFLNLLGSLFLARSFFISKKDSLELGVSRWASNEDEENFKLPQVKNQLKQRKWGIIGAILLFIGFILQVIRQVL